MVKQDDGMEVFVELPGLERLMEICHRLKLQLQTSPPSQSPPKAGELIAGLSMDRVLSAVYSRLGFAVFATDVDGIILRRYDDTERKLEEDNRWWSEGYRKRLALPTLIFAGEPMMAYHYATVPSLADAQGRQPVVMVDVYEDPYAIPVASDVDCFFDAYSRYLESLMAIPGAREETSMTFPWSVSDIIGRDARLVEMIHEGRFDVLMPNIEARGWSQKVVNAGRARQ
jgi:hypothetical protein